MVTRLFLAGMPVTHQLAEGNVELTVVRSVVQPRLTEIRALARSECKDLAPIITTATETSTFAVKDAVIDPVPSVKA